MPEPLHIDSKDLFSPDVEAYLETQNYLQRDAEELAPRSLFARIVYSSWFYLSICCGAGALLSWSIIEPFLDDNDFRQSSAGRLAALLMFPTVAAGVGLFLGAAEGIMCRNFRRAFLSGIVGLGIGFAGGIVALIPTGIVFATMTEFARRVSQNPQPDLMPTGIGLLILMMGRGAAWAIVSVPAGLGQGIALGEKKVLLNGIVGGVLGGFLGGLLFDPIYLVLTSADGQAIYSRAIGVLCIGLLVGLFVGLVESWTKTAWLVMRKGPLAGKQFVLFKDTTILGSSPKAEIYLFKDDAIEPRHAIIYNRGGRFELEDSKTPDGTYVNGIAIKRHFLQNADKIVIGKTVLEFSLREKNG